MDRRPTIRGLGVLVSFLAAMAGIASPPLTTLANASARGADGRRIAFGGSTSRVRLAQAPEGLQAGVLATVARANPADPGTPHRPGTPETEIAGYFGWAVALSGDIAVVGAKSTRPHGAAYVFIRTDAGEWLQEARLSPSNGAVSFGYSVAISGQTAVIGDPNAGERGAVYVFVRSGTHWTQQAKLGVPPGNAYTDFGVSVGVSGSTIVVGSRKRPTGTGIAYVFVRSRWTWSVQAALEPAPGSPLKAFAKAVAVSRSTVVVGAEGANAETGVAYVFERSGGVWTQVARLTASDGAAGDLFGAAVAISGSTIAVSGFVHDQAKGAVYVYARSRTGWFQQAELEALDGQAGDNLGYSVGVSRDTIVAGAYHRDQATGVAYVFSRSGSTWFQQARLVAADGNEDDFFGQAVAVSRTTVLVGAWGRFTYSGAAYLYKWTSPTWSQEAEVWGTDGASGFYFGDAVAISGSTAIVGAFGRGLGKGAVFVFVRSGSDWVEEAELTASDGISEDLFGYSVAISGSTALVGAFGADREAGAAYVFTRTGGAWSEEARITPSDGAEKDHFGASVAISGDSAVVGTFRENEPGAAYVFTRSGSTWEEQARVAASDGSSYDEFGWSVGISESTLVVGAPGREAAYVFVGTGGNWTETAKMTGTGSGFGRSVTIDGPIIVVGAYSSYSSGSAFVFVDSGTAWTQEAQLRPSDGAPYFGWSVSISGSTVVVGAYEDHVKHGAAFVYESSGGSWSEEARLIASDGAWKDFFGYSVAIDGDLLMVGADEKEQQSGAAYAFSRIGGPWVQEAEFLP